MKTIYVDNHTQLNQMACVATIGFFDGVHRGHQFLIGQVCKQAKAEGMAAMVITFDRHPRQVLHNDNQPLLLTTTTEKLRLLEETGVDIVAVLHFDREMASLTACNFMKQVLLDKLKVQTLMIGYDSRFGRGRTESFNDYVCATGSNWAFVLSGAKLFYYMASTSARLLSGKLYYVATLNLQPVA